MTKDEALKLALDALIDCDLAFEECKDYPLTHDAVLLAIYAIREVLAQPEQEPVAWVCHGVNGKHDVDFDESEINAIPVGTLFYTAPSHRTWVGLTDEEIGYYIVHSLGTATKKNLVGLIRLCEAKLKEKNT